MSTRKEDMAFLFKRFKGFWDQYKQSKRGVLGIVIIAFFAVVAIFAPVIAPLNPLSPTMPGYYPGQTPRIAEKVCVPAWYRSIGGAQNLSENVLVMEDHEFAIESTYDQWTRTKDSPYISIQYSPTGGSNNDNGYIEITYKREETEAAPEKGFATATLGYEFEYPYNQPPRSFWIHYSVKIDNRTNLEPFPLTVRAEFRRGEEPDIFTFRTRSISVENALGKYYHKATISAGYTGVLEETIFTEQGKYTYYFIVDIIDTGAGKVDLTVDVDNVQLLCYGQAYGLLGTDANENTPRDLFTMLVHGTRISFMIGLLTAVFSVFIGLAIGLISGYVRGLVDEGLMRFADFLLVLPGLPLLIVLVTVLGRSIWNIIGVLVFMGWMGFSRSVRSMVLSLRERPFVESAKAAGAGTFYVIYRHILPNVFALVYISMATSVPGAIISEASLAWLGLGDKNIPSWGMILYDFSRTQTAIVKGLGEYWFWVLPPGIAIALMAMAFILMGFSLDEILNPKLRKRR